jgi:hypothetical protein
MTLPANIPQSEGRIARPKADDGGKFTRIAMVSHRFSMTGYASLDCEAFASSRLRSERTSTNRRRPIVVVARYPAPISSFTPAISVSCATSSRTRASNEVRYARGPTIKPKTFNE